jgi:hypothetical protein
VLDNLNTHHKSSLYEAFDPIEAKRLADKLDISLPYTFFLLNSDMEFYRERHFLI